MGLATSGHTRPYSAGKQRLARNRDYRLSDEAKELMNAAIYISRVRQLERKNLNDSLKTNIQELEKGYVIISKYLNHGIPTFPKSQIYSSYYNVNNLQSLTIFVISKKRELLERDLQVKKSADEKEDSNKISVDDIIKASAKTENFPNETNEEFINRIYEKNKILIYGEEYNLLPERKRIMKAFGR